MQILTRMNMVVIKDYYHMTTMNEIYELDGNHEMNTSIVNLSSKP
jgi:hypothetical protein